MNVGHCFWGHHVCVAAASVVTLVMGFSLAFLHTTQCRAPRVDSFAIKMHCHYSNSFEEMRHSTNKLFS